MTFSRSSEDRKPLSERRRAIRKPTTSLTGFARDTGTLAGNRSSTGTTGCSLRNGPSVALGTVKFRPVTPPIQERKPRSSRSSRFRCWIVASSRCSGSMAHTGPSLRLLARRPPRVCSPEASRCDCGSYGDNPTSNAASTRSGIGSCCRRCDTCRRSVLPRLTELSVLMNKISIVSKSHYHYFIRSLALNTRRARSRAIERRSRFK